MYTVTTIIENAIGTAKHPAIFDLTAEQVRDYKSNFKLQWAGAGDTITHSVTAQKLPRY